MLGQPCYMKLPDVIGFRLTGKLRPGVTATDLVLTIVQILRRVGVVGKFVEFCGEGYQIPNAYNVSYVGCHPANPAKAASVRI